MNQVKLLFDTIHGESVEKLIPLTDTIFISVNPSANGKNVTIAHSIETEGPLLQDLSDKIEEFTSVSAFYVINDTITPMLSSKAKEGETLISRYSFGNNVSGRDGAFVMTETLTISMR